MTEAEITTTEGFYSGPTNAGTYIFAASGSPSFSVLGYFPRPNTPIDIYAYAPNSTSGGSYSFLGQAFSGTTPFITQNAVAPSYLFLLSGLSIPTSLWPTGGVGGMYAIAVDNGGSVVTPHPRHRRQRLRLQPVLSDQPLRLDRRHARRERDQAPVPPVPDGDEQRPSELRPRQLRPLPWPRRHHGPVFPDGEPEPRGGRPVLQRERAWTRACRGLHARGLQAPEPQQPDMRSPATVRPATSTSTRRSTAASPYREHVRRPGGTRLRRRAGVDVVIVAFDFKSYASNEVWFASYKPSGSSAFRTTTTAFDSTGHNSMVPNNCTSCHGGTAAVNVDGASDTRGYLLPLDVASFGYGSNTYAQQAESSAESPHNRRLAPPPPPPRLRQRLVPGAVNTAGTAFSIRTSSRRAGR